MCHSTPTTQAKQLSRADRARIQCYHPAKTNSCPLPSAFPPPHVSAVPLLDEKPPLQYRSGKHTVRSKHSLAQYSLMLIQHLPPTHQLASATPYESDQPYAQTPA